MNPHGTMFRFVLIVLFALIQFTISEANVSKYWSSDREQEKIKNINEAPSPVNDKFLDFSNLSLVELSKDEFKNFTKLERLDLSGNKLTSLRGSPFSYLSNLKHLDLRNNQIRKLDASDLFGIGNETNILVLGNNITTINGHVFGSPDGVPWKPTVYNCPAPPPFILEATAPSKIKACIREGTLEKLEVLMDDEILEPHCREVMLHWKHMEIFLNGSGIMSFSAGWYRLQDYDFRRLSLHDNNIVDLSREILNELPRSIYFVNLAGNKIERLAKNSMTNRFFRILNFSNNSISEIEDGTFASENITELDLSGNHLKNVKFVASSSSSLVSLSLSRNQIEEITPDVFFKLSHLSYLDLSANDISEIKNNSLRGLSSLEHLILSENEIGTIDSGSFRDLKKLDVLNLQKNKLSDLQAGTFDGIETYVKINLSFNNLTKVSKDWFSFSINIDLIDLSHNQIEVLETGAFVLNSIKDLFLGNNKIKKIEPGAFNITCNNIDLSNNLWSHPDGEIFKDVHVLRYLDLQNNGIENIENGFAKYLNQIMKLNLSQNRIRELVNGAFYGIPMWGEIKIIDTPIELIQSGLFLIKQNRD